MKNVEFFKKWSNDMAYILGVWASDGCIWKSNNNLFLYLGISEKDIKWLEVIKNMISWEN